MASLVNSATEYLKSAKVPNQALAESLRQQDLLCRDCLKLPAHRKLCDGSRQVFRESSLNQTQVDTVVCFKAELDKLIKESNFPTAYLVPDSAINESDCFHKYDEKVLFVVKEHEPDWSYFKSGCSGCLHNLIYYRFPMLAHSFEAAQTFSEDISTRKVLVLEGFDFRIHSNGVSDKYLIGLAEFLTREETKLILVLDKNVSKDAMRALTPIQEIVSEFLQNGCDL